jgi:transposase-like protein
MARRADSNRAGFWRELIQRRRHSGLSVARVCEQAGVSPASFYRWQRQLRGGPALGPNAASDRGSSAAAPQSRCDPRAGSRLVPVQIVADPPTGRDESAGQLEVELPGEIRLRIPAGCDRAMLELVIQLLRTPSSREAG